MEAQVEAKLESPIATLRLKSFDELIIKDMHAASDGGFGKQAITAHIADCSISMRHWPQNAMH